MKKLIMGFGLFASTGIVIFTPILLTISIVYKWHGFLQLSLVLITSCIWIGLIDVFWKAAQKDKEK